jgi:hypothetical protein
MTKEAEPKGKNNDVAKEAAEHKNDAMAGR